MVNVSNIMESNYNLTGIFSNQTINDPVTWFGNFNNVAGGFIIIGILAAFMVILFLSMRKVEGVSDSVAGVYAGYITSIIAVFLFLVSLPLDPSIKLLNWVHIVPILVITGVFIFLSKTTMNY